jgi:hypothetical protein
MFNINQIVSGKVAGHFVVLGYRTVGGERVVQVKPYNTVTGATGRGEFAISEDSLKVVA